MKKLFFLAVIAFAAVFSACSDSYDDTQLRGELENLADRVAKLEAWQKQVNSDVAALQAIAESLDGAKFITNVETVAEGYKITFSDGKTVTVKHGDKGEQGEQGEKGNTPAIGIAEEDGVYYWTLDGEWLLDAQGNKVPAQGAKGDQGDQGEQGPAGEQGPQGEQGLTPEFKIENGHWYVRFGEGEWQDLGEAKGEQGDSFFKDVKVGEDSVVFTMADGTEFTVPFIANAKFSDIQSLKFVPEYADNMGSVLFSTKEDATIEMNFEVLPKKYAAVIAANAEAVALKAVYTETRGSVEFIDLAVTAVEADVENGIVCVKASASALSDEFFAGTQTASVRFSVEDEESGVASGYVPVVPMFQMTVEVSTDNLYQAAKLNWIAAPEAASYKVLANGQELASVAELEYTIAEGTLNGAKEYDLEVIALDAEGQKIANVVAENVAVWTLINRPEPAVYIAGGKLIVENAELHEGESVKNNLDVEGVLLEAEVYFYKNGAAEPAYTAVGSYLDTYPSADIQTSINEKKMKNNVAGSYNTWKWNGAETATNVMPELGVGEYTIKYKAGYYAVRNAKYERGDRITYSDPSDVLAKMVYREGEVADKYVVEMKATASSNGVLDGANISWSAVAGASGYEILANGEKIADVGADVTTYELRDATAAKYEFEVKATGTTCSATTEEVGIYSVKDWKEPTFEWNGKRMIVHDLTGVNADGQGYAYGGDIDNNSPAAKSFIEIYDEAGTTLLYTLTNGTGQSNLKKWAEYGRWALDTQEDRKDWVWTDSTGACISSPDPNKPAEGDVAASYMPAGKYTFKWTIGYVLCKNAYYAKDQVEIDRAEATQLWFGPKDTNPSPNVCYTDDTHSAVMIVAKSGETAYEVVAPESLDLVVKVDGLYQGAKLSWNKILGATNYEVLVDGQKVADVAEPTYTVENLTDKQFYSFTVKCAGMADSTVENVEVFTLCNWQEPDLQFNQLENGNYEVKAVGLVDLNYAYAGGATITLSKDGEVVHTLFNDTGDGTLMQWAGFKRWALGAVENRKDWQWDGALKDNGDRLEVSEHFIAPGEYEVAWQWDYVVNKNGQWATHNGNFVPQENKEGATYVYISNGAADVLTKDGAPVRFTKSGTQTLTVASNIILNPQANVAGLYQGMKLTWNPNDAVASYAIGYGKDSVEETVEIGEPVTEYTLEGLDQYQKYYVKVTALDAEGAELKSEELKDVEVFTLVNWQEPELQFNLQEDGTYQVVAAGLVDLNYAYTGAATITLSKNGEVVHTLANDTNNGTLTAWANGGRWALNAMDNRKDWQWDGALKDNGDRLEVASHEIAPGTYDVAWEWSYSVNKNGQWATYDGSKFIPQENKEGATYVYFSGKSADVLFGTDGVPQRFAKSGTTTLTIEEPVAAPQKVTVAEFLAAAEDDTMYELTGVITRVTNTTYGNFDLTDETGTVYIYGLNSPANEEKYWAASGAKLGDTITVQTVRTSHNGSPQGDHALFVSLVPFVAQKSEWGIVGDLNSWNAPDVPMMTTWKSDKLFVAENVNIASGAFKIRANEEWNNAKNYGLTIGGKIYADKYYTVWSDGGSSNITPMEYGTYDVWFDLENKRVAVMTPGKDYSAAVDGGEPVVVVEGLTEHTWGVAGSFQGWNPANSVPMTIEGDWAVAKNINLVNGDKFKFAADGSWDLSYGAACDVNVGEVYITYNNGSDMHFVGEAGAYNIYFSMVDAKFYMEKYVEAPAEASSVKFSYSDIVAQNSNLTQNGYGSQDVNTESTWINWTLGDFTFKGAKVCTPPAGDNSGYLQTQGHDSTKAKQGFIINDTAFGKITKIVVKSFNVKYVPNFNLYVGTEKNPAGTAIPAGDYSDAGVATGAGKLYTTTFELDGNYTYFKIYNNTTGALYLDSVEVFYE